MKKYVPWILAVVGGWLVAAPFVLNYASTEVAKHNDVGVGLVILLGSLVWGGGRVASPWHGH